MMIIPLFSAQMKSAIMLDQIFLKAQLMFVTYMLEFLINFLASLLFISMITCLWDRLFVVILIFGLGLILELLITFWTRSIFLFRRFGNVSLIFNVFIVIFDVEKELVYFEEDEACIYDFFWGALMFFLKYFDNLLIFFRDFARIEEGRNDIKVSFAISFSLGEAWGLLTCRLNLDLILFLKVDLLLSMKRLFQWDS